MAPELKALQHAISECMEQYQNASKFVRSKRVMNVMLQHAKEIGSEAFIYGRENDNPEGLFEHLENKGLLARTTREEKFMPVQYYLERYGWDRPMKIIDSKKLIQSYKGPNGEEIKPTNFFNGSIIIHKGRRWMAYRMDIHPWTKYTRLAMCEMDKNWDVIPGTNWLLNLKACDYFSEDPRLFIAEDDQLFLTYADGFQIGLAMIDPENKKVIANVFCDKPLRMRMEKNWMFFQDEDKVKMIYSILPHTIYTIVDGHLTEKLSSNAVVTHWEWGELRGSTCPVRSGKYNYAFFHSHVQYAPKMKGFIHRQYHVGVYLFEPKAPYNIVAISREPIYSGPYIHPQIPHGGNHNFNIFPCGAVFEDGEWTISCGINDHEIGLLTLSHAEICTNLEWIS